MTAILFPIYVFVLWIALPVAILWYVIGRNETSGRTDP